jgi:hypothetical protein
MTQRRSAGAVSHHAKSPSNAAMTWNDKIANTAGKPCGAYIETPCKFTACRALKMDEVM